MADAFILTASQETPEIASNLDFYEDLLNDLDGDRQPVQNNQMLRDICCITFPEIRRKLGLLIGICQDSEDLPSLLSLFDRTEALHSEYTRRMEKIEAFNASPSSSSTSNPSPEWADADIKGKGKETLVVKKDGADVFAKGLGAGSEGQSGGSSPSPSPNQQGSEGMYGGVGYVVAEGPSECPICCMDGIAPHEFYMYVQCKHGYCLECLEGYYTTKINEGKVLDIKCPFPGCATVVEYHQVHDVVPEDVFQKYEDFTFMASLNQDPSVRWCPKAGCGNAMIPDPERRDCHCQCGHDFCGECREDTHTGTCEEFQEWKRENGLVDKKYDKWVTKNTKKCPQCKTPIEKAQGCNHMTCTHCRHEWCWLCMRKYTINHFDIYNIAGCPGMQGGSRQYGAARRIGLRALLGTTMVVGGALVAALAIPTLILAGPAYGGYKLARYHRKKKLRFARYGRPVH